MSSSTAVKPADDTATTQAGTATRSTGELVLDILSALARFGMAYVWISAGWQKVTESHINMVQTVEAYEIFTPYWSDLIAQVIGPLELAGGLLLLLGIKIRWAGGVSFGVLLIFIMGLYSAHTRGLVIDCGCFDPATADPQEGALLKSIWRDVAYLAVTAFMMWRPFKKFAIYP